MNIWIRQWTPMYANTPSSAQICAICDQIFSPHNPNRKKIHENPLSLWINFFSSFANFAHFVVQYLQG